MNHNQPSEPQSATDRSKELEDLYMQFFTPPASEQEGEFEQVSLFDYSVPTYCSNTTAQPERHRA